MVKAEQHIEEVSPDDLLFWSYVALSERPTTLHNIIDEDEDEMEEEDGEGGEMMESD